MSFRYEVLQAGDKSVSKAKTLDEILHVLVDGVNLVIGAKELCELFGHLSTIEQDLLTIGAAILAADRASKRGEREEFNRRISLELSLYNVDKFYPLLRPLVKILRYLSKDAWAIDLRVTKSKPQWGDLSDRACMGEKKQGSVLLFSGGLDSLAGALELGPKGPLMLVSHITRNRVTDQAQSDLADLLRNKRVIADHAQIFVSSKDGGLTNLEHDVEPSQRTRSIVFMILGAIVARRQGFHRVIYMAENGQMAIHLPLSGGRIGAFSTHTAHPTVLAMFKEFLATILGFQIELDNPFLYETKGEVVARVVKNLPAGLPVATSCWRNARVVKGGANHCGECVPCLIRRIAIESNGKDPTQYRRDLLSEDIKHLNGSDEGRRNFTDIAEFVMRFSKQSNRELLDEFPDLISNDFDAVKVIEMYRRFGKEARRVLSGYPQLKAFLA